MTEKVSKMVRIWYKPALEFDMRFQVGVHCGQPPGLGNMDSFIFNVDKRSHIHRHMVPGASIAIRYTGHKLVEHMGCLEA